jgi:hypothetical protein
VKLLKKLSNINKPLEIKFEEMMHLMKQCDLVDKRHEQSKSRKRGSKYTNLYQRDATSNVSDLDYPNDAPVHFEEPEERGSVTSSPFSLLSGVFPGNN